MSSPRHLHHKSEENLGEASVGSTGHCCHWKPGWCQCHLLQEYWPGLWNSMCGFCCKAYRCFGMYRKAVKNPRIYSKNIWNWVLEEFPKLKIVNVFITSHLRLKIHVSLCIFLCCWISRNEKWIWKCGPFNFLSPHLEQSSLNTRRLKKIFFSCLKIT